MGIQDAIMFLTEEGHTVRPCKFGNSEDLFIVDGQILRCESVIDFAISELYIKDERTTEDENRPSGRSDYGARR